MKKAKSKKSKKGKKKGKKGKKSKKGKKGKKKSKVGFQKLNKSPQFHCREVFVSCAAGSCDSSSEYTVMQQDSLSQMQCSSVSEVASTGQLSHNLCFVFGRS